MAKCIKCGKIGLIVQNTSWCSECYHKLHGEERPMTDYCGELVTEDFKKRLSVKLDLGNNVVFVDSIKDVKDIRAYQDTGWGNYWKVHLTLKNGESFGVSRGVKDKSYRDDVRYTNLFDSKEEALSFIENFKKTQL